MPLFNVLAVIHKQLRTETTPDIINFVPSGHIVGESMIVANSTPALSVPIQSLPKHNQLLEMDMRDYLVNEETIRCSQKDCDTLVDNKKPFISKTWIPRKK